MKATTNQTKEFSTGMPESSFDRIHVESGQHSERRLGMMIVNVIKRMNTVRLLGGLALGAVILTSATLTTPGFADSPDRPLVTSQQEFGYPPELLPEIIDAHFASDKGHIHDMLDLADSEREFGYPPELLPEIIDAYYAAKAGESSGLATSIDQDFGYPLELLPEIIDAHFASNKVHIHSLLVRAANDLGFGYPPELLPEVIDRRFEINTGWPRPANLESE